MARKTQAQLSSNEASSIMDSVKQLAQNEQDNAQEENMLANDIEQKMQAELQEEKNRLEREKLERQAELEQRNAVLDALMTRSTESEFIAKLEKRVQTAKYSLSTVQGRKTQQHTTVYRSAYRLSVVVGDNVQTVLKIGSLVNKGSSVINAQQMKYDYGLFTLDGLALQKNETLGIYSYVPLSAYRPYDYVGKETIELSSFEFGEIQGSVLTPSYSELREQTGIVNAFIKRCEQGVYRHEFALQLAQFEDFDYPLYVSIMKRKTDGLTAQQKQQRQYGILADMMSKIDKS